MESIRDDYEKYLKTYGRNYNWWVEFVIKHDLDNENPDHQPIIRSLCNSHAINARYVTEIIKFAKKYGTFVGTEEALIPYLLQEAVPEGETELSYISRRLDALLTNKDRHMLPVHISHYKAFHAKLISACADPVPTS
jgi:hypothetical protein